MDILKKLFATYYFYFVRQRKFMRKNHLLVLDRSEDSGAVGLLILSEMLCLALIGGIIRKAYFFVLPKYFVIIGLLVYAVAVILQYRFFVSNRMRRDDIIEAFRVMPDQKRRSWSYIALAVIIVPLALFPFLLRK
jgi:hypothetical protein